MAIKRQLETISPDANSSFRLLHNPRLSDLFYWHFHPEYELVYINNASGTRHVGDHISNYEHSDLVLIGSNIPHLNFDYNVRTDYEKIVIHFKKEFVSSHLSDTPEFHSIFQLFRQSSKGVAFSKTAQSNVGIRILTLNELSPFQRYFEILSILSELAGDPAKQMLHEIDYINPYDHKEQERLRGIYTFVDKHYSSRIQLEEVAQVCNLSREAFCRYFKKSTGLTFVTFLNQYRVSQSKRLLMDGSSVSRACYESGFESLSYYNRVFRKVTGENPRSFKSKFK